MTIPANTAFEVRPSTGADANGGAFVLSGPTYPTDLTATNGNTATPTVSSATYTFVAGDVGSYLYLKQGTNWLPQLAPIVSVSGGSATLGAAVSTTASPTGGTFTVDYSQQASPNTAFDGTVITAHTAGATSTIIITGRATFAADAGNVLNITGGVNATAGRYVVNSVSIGVAGVGTWTLDRNCCTGAMTGMTGNMGGAAKTIPNVMTDWSAVGAGGSKCFVKAEATIVTTATITLNAPSGAPSTTIFYNKLIGYTNARADGGKATIQLSTNSSLFGLKTTTVGWEVRNFIVDCNSLTTSVGIQNNAGTLLVQNCVVKNFTSKGIDDNLTSGTWISDCEITGGTSAASSATVSSGGRTSIVRCNIHDNVCVGILVSEMSYIGHNLLTNNSGATSDGIQISSGLPTSRCVAVLNNTIYKSGRDGIRMALNMILNIRNNILASNGGYGFNVSSGPQPANAMYDGNAYGGGTVANTSGARNNMDDGAAGTAPTNFINLVAPYTNVLDVTLTGDPFTNAAGGDFTLNATAGGGAACRGAGTPGAMPGVSQVGHLDMGCFQHADPVGGGGGNPNLIIGLVTRP